MNILEKELSKYKKKGFTVAQKRTLKYGKRIFLKRQKGGLSGLLGAYEGIYIYFVDGDATVQSMREFLKDYPKFFRAEKFTRKDKGIILCSGSIDKKTFGDLKDALIKRRRILNTIKVLSCRKKKLVTVERKRRTIEEERIKEKITEREIVRRRVTEKRISVRGLLNKIKKFEPPTRPKKEKQLENMLVSYLQAFYDVRTQLTYERARIDAKIGTIGIEIKYQPSAGDFDRLYGQIEKYLKHLDYVVVVIGSEKSKEDTKYFKNRLKERDLLNNRVFVTSI